MTFQQTIEALYQDIALIKEEVCEVSNQLQLLATYSLSTATTIDFVGAKIKIIGVTSSNPIALSKIFDYGDSDFNEYTYAGFGTCCEILEHSGVKYGGAWRILSQKNSLIHINEYSNKFRIRPYNGSSFLVNLFGEVP